MPATIQPYDPERDSAAVFELWQRTLGQEWPLTPALFQQVIGHADTARARGHFVAVEESAIVGFIATQAQLSHGSTNPQGNIVALYVAPEARRRGIGSALVARGSELLKARGASYSFIEWTWALEFYGRLGYSTWRSYAMSWRDL